MESERKAFCDALRRSHWISSRSHIFSISIVILKCSLCAQQQIVAAVLFYWLKNSFRFYYRIYVWSFCWLLRPVGIWQHVVCLCTWHTYISRHQHQSLLIVCAVLCQYVFWLQSFWIRHVLLLACMHNEKCAEAKINCTTFSTSDPSASPFYSSSSSNHLAIKNACANTKERQFVR